MMVTVRLLKPAKDTVVIYQARLLERRTGYMLVQARWERELTDLGCVAFVPGDQLYEHFYADRWYTIYELHSAEGRLKGWYCNITRPAVLGADTIESEDLELDLFVPPDRRNPLLLDEEEYAARDIAGSDPSAHQAVMAALTELQDMARRGDAPFTGAPPRCAS